MKMLLISSTLPKTFVVKIIDNSKIDTSSEDNLQREKAKGNTVGMAINRARKVEIKGLDKPSNFALETDTQHRVSQIAETDWEFIKTQYASIINGFIASGKVRVISEKNTPKQVEKQLEESKSYTSNLDIGKSLKSKNKKLKLFEN